MSNNKILDTALSIIDKNICLDHKEIARKIYAETGYCDQDYNKFIAVITSGSLTLRDYIRKRRLFFAANELTRNPKKTIIEIAFEYGYSDQTAFARAIKKEFKKTPAEIRKKQESVSDIREILEYNLSNRNRLDSIFDKIELNCLSSTDIRYFESFIHATDQLGFDTSTCCLISELSEKLSIPFGYLIEELFKMSIQCEKYGSEETAEYISFMMELQIDSEDELEEICQHYNCKWYELNLVKVKMYQLGIESEKELEKIWNYYNCQWTNLSTYPLTKQMVKDYYEKMH